MELNVEWVEEENGLGGVGPGGQVYDAGRKKREGSIGTGRAVGALDEDHAGLIC